VTTVVKDIDGNSYETVRIGNQIWITENLKVTKYRNGDPIPNLTSSDDWTATSKGAYCNFGNDDGNVETYGRLYNWHAVNDVRGLAPDGWHIPTDEQWGELVEYLGGAVNAGGKLKATGTTQNGDGLWSAPNSGATNESGFAALPGGCRDGDMGIYAFGGSFGLVGFFWSSTDEIFGKAPYRLSLENEAIPRVLDWNRSEVSSGLSVRCMRG